MIDIISRITTSREFLNMSPNARLLFYDLCTYSNKERTFDYNFLSGVIEMTHSTQAAFEQIYQNGFVVVNKHGNYVINKYFDMVNVLTEEAPRTGFPPTVEKVVEYCGDRIADNKRKDFCERFVDYYNANGWKLSNGRPIKDWKAVLNLWIRKEIKPAKDNGLYHSYDANEFFKLALEKTEKEMGK